MKTSAIEVHDMLSVFTVYEVEKRIGEVPGVESATVNFAVGNATVRYDETRVDAVNIKSSVRPRSYEASAPAGATPGGGHEGHEAPATLSEAPKSATPDAPPAEPAAAPVGEAHKGKVADENS